PWTSTRRAYKWITTPSPGRPCIGSAKPALRDETTKENPMAGTLTKEQPERRATAVRELLAAMRQAYEEDPTTRALIDAMVGCVTNGVGRPYSGNNVHLLAGQ